MDSPADDHKSTLVRLAGCYELVTAFTRFLAESSDVLLGEDVDSAGETGGSGTYFSELVDPNAA